MTFANAPFLPLGGFWQDKSRVEAVYKFDGQTYYLRQLGRYVFYHLEGEDSIKQTRFVCCDSPNGVPDWPSKIKPKISSHHDNPLLVEQEDGAISEMYVDNGKPKPTFNAGKGITRSRVYPEAAFAAQVRNGESGRYALHRSQAYRECVVVLFLRQDGTGTCLHDTRAFFQDQPEAGYRIDFAWRETAQNIARPADILTAPWESVRALCEDLLRQEICPRMADPFVSYADLPDEPFAYIRGSEQELERLTRCILHIHPEFFEIKDKRHRQASAQGLWPAISVTYLASTTQKPGGPDVTRKDARRHLLKLAFEHNRFAGGAWHRRYKCEGRQRECYDMVPERRRFLCAPPSMHEQSEALLALHDWLEDKVSERERRRLLGLDPPPATKNKPK